MFMGDGVAGSKRGYSIKDSGSASRFFFTAKPDEEMYSLKYCVKASKRERNAGLEGLPDIEQHGHYAQDEWSKQNMGNTPDAKREPTKTVS